MSMAIFNNYFSLPEGIIDRYSNSIQLMLPSSKPLQFANLKMAIEIVDLPMKNGGSFHSFL